MCYVGYLCFLITKVAVCETTFYSGTQARLHSKPIIKNKIWHNSQVFKVSIKCLDNSHWRVFSNINHIFYRHNFKLGFCKRCYIR